MEIQATEKRSNNGRREKLEKKGLSDDGGACGVDGWACQRQMHLLEEARVKTVLHAPPRAGSEIGACDVIFRRGFHRKVDRREVLLLVCSLTGMEVVGKSSR